MNHKSFGWAAVLGCILSVTIAVIGGHESQPPLAQANPAQFGNTQTTWTGQDAQACKAVVNQMNAIRQATWNENLTDQAAQLAAMDDLVCRQARIDASKCPADFRKAEARYVAALNTMSVNAHIDFARNGAPAFRVIFDNDSNQYTQNLAANASDAMKRDIAETRTAAEQFQRVAAKYGARW